MRDNFKSRGQQMFFGLPVVMKQYVDLYRKLCCENDACRTSSIKRQFQTKHEKLLKDDSKKNEAFKKPVSRYEQSSILEKSFAIQIKLRKVATKLQNVSRR